jgi:hypothetical protein
MENTLAEVREYYRKEAVRAQIHAAVVESLTADPELFLAQQFNKSQAVRNIVSAATPIAN